MQGTLLVVDFIALSENQLSGVEKTEENADIMVQAARNSVEMVDLIQGLEKRIDNLERSWTTWQSASDFVNDLATYIYPPDTKVTFGPMFTNLMLWLQQYQNTPEGEVANRKWNALQRKANFEWTDDHKNVLEKMLTCKRIDFDVSFSNEDIRRRGEILMIHEFIKSN